LSSFIQLGGKQRTKPALSLSKGTTNNLDQGAYPELPQRNKKFREMAKEPKPRNNAKLLTRIFKALSLQKIYHHEIV
jgi:hypothetical protein